MYQRALIATEISKTDMHNSLRHADYLGVYL